MIPVKKENSGPAAREFSDIPYAGLFGDTVMARVVEEIVADPHSVYHLRDLEDLTGNSAPRIRDALTMLTKLGMLKSTGGKHPAYTVDMSKKTFVALTLLACAVLDDREGSDCMETAVPALLRDPYDHGYRRHDRCCGTGISFRPGNPAAGGADSKSPGGLIPARGE